MAKTRFHKELERRFREVLKQIPVGFYCYDDRGKCPFWDIEVSAPKDGNGFCHLLGRGDKDDDEDDSCPPGLLWDQCKACGVNDE